MKRSGGRRYYRAEDIQLLQTIKSLLYDEQFTIKGAQNSLKKRSVSPSVVEQPVAVDPVAQPALNNSLEEAEALLKQAEERMNKLLNRLGA